MEKPGLPKPNVHYPSPSSDTLDEEGIKGMVCNPIYAGLPPFPQVISDEAWVQAAAQLINEEGPEQFLVNMLYMLRQSMDRHLNPPAPATSTISADEASGPSASSSSISLYCYHDDFPMIEIRGMVVCVAEYIFEHLDNAPITDLITQPELALVFQNGHTLPLLPADSDYPLELDDEDMLLENLTGLSIVDVEWDDDYQNLILYFGHLISDDDDDDDDAYTETRPMASIAIQLDAIHNMTCPHHSMIDSDPDDV